MPRFVAPLDMSGQPILGLATALTGDNSQQAANTAFVTQAVSAINGTVGATTPATGAFTTTTVSGKATMNGGRQSAYTAKTAAYSVVAATDYCIHCTTGTFAVTLPTAVGIAGQEFIIKNSGAGVITVATTSSQTIDGAATAILSTQYGSLSVMSDGANYFIN